jgi:hypothetical protein
MILYVWIFTFLINRREDKKILYQMAKSIPCM